MSHEQHAPNSGRLPEIETIRKRIEGIQKIQSPNAHPQKEIIPKAARSEWFIGKDEVEKLFTRMDEVSEWILTQDDGFSTRIIGKTLIQDGLIALDDALQRLSIGNESYFLTTDVLLLPSETQTTYLDLDMEDRINSTFFHFDLDQNAFFSLQLSFIEPVHNKHIFTYSVGQGKEKGIEDMTREEYHLVNYYLDRCVTENKAYS